ncbi:gliding motility-associated C-terminal domain-containing protein [Ascidiimonas aurantiaca]|uniref:Ig-like domain-containing protein n=1 Tax=Ascidiimonas aurantiaca TaxID=1685432 RepID=UPI0030EE5C65
MKCSKRFHIAALLCALFLLHVCPSHSQTLNKPVPYFTAPCISDNFNSYKVEFEWSPPLVNNTNEFILELSNGNGSFSNPTVLSTVSNKNTTLKFEFNFSFPANTRGENYKVRVRSTNPARTSPESNSFPAYYQTVRESLLLGDENGNPLFGEFYICDGSSFRLQVLNFPGEASYRWFRNRNITPIAGANKYFLDITQPGYYYVEVDYGDYCSSSTSSNEVGVELDNFMGIAIEGSANVEVCTGSPYVLKANIDDSDLIYRWFKNGTLQNTPGYLPEFTLSTTDPQGMYVVEIENPGGCSETSAPVTVTAPNINVSIASDADVLLLPGESVSLNVATNAQSPSYQWFKDNTAVSGATTPSLTISTPGVYKARVIQGTGCAVATFSNEITIAFPQDFEIIIAAQAPYSECTQTDATLHIQTINAITSSTTINATAQLVNNFTYQWQFEGQPLSGATASTISLSDPSENGTYRVTANLNAFTVTSNDLPVKLQPDINPIITSNGNVSCNGATTITITSSITDAGYSYKWYLDNAQLPETGSVLNTNLTGVYKLGVMTEGCIVFSNELVINPFEDSVVTVDAPERIVIAEGFSKTVTASGADTYAWFNQENMQISNTASVTLMEEGQYILRANVGECQVVKSFTVVYQDSFVVPNIISPNSDGINDLWVIPNSYAFKNDVEVFIYGPNGENVFRAVGYQNNWPESNLSYPVNKPVFYYKIVRGREILKQGTITLIR